MTNNSQQDALKRINGWLELLEQRAQQILATFSTDNLEPAKAAAIAERFITIMARLLELRQQFMKEGSGDEERLLEIIFGQKPEKPCTNGAALDQ